MHSSEILAANPDFVPTGLDRAESDCGGKVNWQTAMKNAIRSGVELRRRLGLAVDSAAAAAESFPTFVPLEYLSRIKPRDPDDPLLLQVLPVDDELADRPGYVSDPVGDLNAKAAGGLLHKYDGRALIITTGACGIHCRYCFRREFPYASAGSVNDSWGPALEYMRRHPEIDEVLLSGGDPLTLVDKKLFELINEIESISHVRRLRIHSRMPIVIPQRVTQAMVSRLSQSRLAVWMVIHANHPSEIDRDVLAATDRLIDVGIPVLNQAVLLRGVNDSVDVLADLCRLLIDHRVAPYYLHQLDRVKGAGHFEVPIAEGLELVKKLRGRLPGYAVPTYVAEEPDKPSKTVLSAH